MNPAEARRNLHAALGAIVEEAASLEATLRITFCALVGSKYADDSRRKLLDALRQCREAIRRRNRLFHDAWAILPSGELAQLQSKRLSHRVDPRDVTYEEIIETCCNLSDARSELSRSRVEAGRDDGLRHHEEAESNTPPASSPDSQ